MDIQSSRFLSIEQMTDKYLTGKQKTENTDEGNSFWDVLNQKEDEQNGELKFSKHAARRLEDRNINLTSDQYNRLNSGAKKASEKGIKESLVLVDKLAFIVNVPNNTVITALDSSETDENVFTNINGAVIM